jgi:hypothetical protein
MMRLAASLFILAAVPSLAAAEAPPLAIRFAQQSITISGVTRGGSILVVGVAHELRGSPPRVPTVVRRAEILRDTDGEGEVRLDVPGGVPRMALWAAIDMVNGAHAAFSSPETDARSVELVPDLVRSDNAGQLRKIEWPFAEIDLFIVRPGMGAWQLYASKASGLDENRHNQNPLRLDVESTIPIADSPAAPRAIRSGDVIVIFDRRGMQYGILEVGR